MNPPVPSVSVAASPWTRRARLAVGLGILASGSLLLLERALARVG